VPTTVCATLVYTSVPYSLPTMSKHIKGKRKTSRKAVTAPPTGVSKVHSTGYYTDFLKNTSGPSVMEKKTTTSLSKKPNSSTKDDNRNVWEKQEEFERVLETLTVSTRGEDGKLVKGDIRQCYHCRINKKPRKDVRVQGQHGNEYLECGCSKNKGVCEKLLVDKGVLGQDKENRELYSISDKEWFKMDHIMASLLGYDTSWLMYKEAMIAGLEAKLAELKEEVE